MAALASVACLPAFAAPPPPFPPESAPTGKIIRFEGVLGNSGAGGGTLVRLSVPAAANQSGLGLDADGFLWAFAGSSQINRYTQDGRLLSAFPLPKAMQRGPQTLVTVSDKVFALGGGALWSLPVSAPAGASPEPLGIPARLLSTNAVGGRVAFVTSGNHIALLDATSKRTEQGPSLAGKRTPRALALLPSEGGGTRVLLDTTLFFEADNAGNWKETPVVIPGAMPQWADGHLYTFAGHTTIRRFTLDGTPAPGVVFGGTGAHLGSLPENGECLRPSGIIHLGGDRFAITGENGVVHLLRWDEARHGFSMTRRVGAIHRAAGLGIDREGRVWWNCGYWDWDSGPADPLANSTAPADAGSDDWQVAVLQNNSLTGLALSGVRAVGPALIRNTADSPPRPKNGRYDALPPDAAKVVPAKATGCAVIKTKDGGEEIVIVDAMGKGVRLRVAANGAFRAVVGPVELKLTSQNPSVTSLGVLPDGTLLAADCGAIVFLRADGGNFQETLRVTEWDKARDKRFGSVLYLADDRSGVWVSDTENNRVLLFSTQQRGGGGRADELVLQSAFTGDPRCGALDKPRRVAACGGRAVVLDSGNQRLVKLAVVPPAGNGKTF